MIFLRPEMFTDGPEETLRIISYFFDFLFQILHGNETDTGWRAHVWQGYAWQGVCVAEACMVWACVAAYSIFFKMNSKESTESVEICFAKGVFEHPTSCLTNQHAIIVP